MKYKRELEKFAKNWVKCSQDPRYFIEEFCMIRDQRLGRAVPFTLWPCQVDLLKQWHENKLCITLKTRQIGVSTLSACWALWNLLFKKFFEAMVVSRKESDAIKYLDKVKFAYNNLPGLYKEMQPLFRPPTRLSMEFKDIESKMLQIGSTIMAESSNPEAGRSETLNLIILDEAAFIPDAMSIWTASEPTLEKAEGQAIVISTGNGYDRFFQPIYQGSKDGDSGFSYIFIPWDGDPARDEKWYQIREKQAISQNRAREFRAEYPRNDVEAFIVSGMTFFDPDLIGKFLKRKERPFWRGDINDKGDFVKHSMGPLKIWTFPKPGAMYCAGVDTAEGVSEGDFSVGAFYDRNSRKQCAEYSGRIDTETFAKRIFSLGMKYNKALLNVEMNSVGESVMNFLSKQRHYPALYRQIRYDTVSKKKVSRLGWRTTVANKRTLLDSLEAFLRQDEMHPESFALFEELKTFVVVQNQGTGSFRYEAQGSKHDDKVIAHSLCAIIFQEKPASPPTRRNTIPKYGQRFGQRKLRQKKKYNLSKLHDI